MQRHLNVNLKTLITCIVLLGVGIAWYSIYQKMCIHSAIEMIETEGYFDEFNVIDYRVRKCKSFERCKKQYYNGLRMPSLYERFQLTKLTNGVDEILKSKGFSVILDIPWKIVFFNPSSESGFPHTHGDIIYLPYGYVDSKKNHTKRLDLMMTLLHEKIHVYQRTYPLHTMSLYVDYWQMDVSGVSSASDARYGNERSNPDINRIRFKDHTNNQISCNYEAKAKTIVQIVDKRDHPHEMMAYSLTDYVFDKTSDPVLDEWSSNYLTHRVVSV